MFFSLPFLIFQIFKKKTVQFLEMCGFCDYCYNRMQNLPYNKIIPTIIDQIDRLLLHCHLDRYRRSVDLTSFTQVRKR